MLLLLSSDVVPVHFLAALLRDIRILYINFVHLVLQKATTGLINEVASLAKI